MSGPGTITVTNTGSISAPSSMTATVASALTSILSRIGSVDVIPIPSARMVLVANGVDFQYHLLDAAQYLNGPLAPYTAPTIAPTAASSSTVLTATAFADNDQINLGVNIVVFKEIYFKSALNTSLGVAQVLRTGTLADDLTRFYKFILGTGVHGTDYYDGYQMTNIGSYDPNYWRTAHKVTASNLNTGAGTMTISATFSGTGGNALSSFVVTGAGLGLSNSPTLAGGTAGTGTAPGPGSFDYAYSRVRKADGAETAVSNITTTVVDVAANIAASAYEAANARDGIDLYRIYRSTDTGSAMYPVGDDSASPFTDDVTDTNLTRDGNDPYDPNVVRSYAAGYPVRYRHHAAHLGSVFGAGAYLHAKQGTGLTAAVTKYDGTNASTSLAVTLSAGTPTTRWIGRTFRVTSDDARYGIVGVDEATKILTLNTPYLGTTDGVATFEVTDERDPNSINYTEALLPNNWPFENSIEGLSSEDPLGNMGLRSMWGALIAWTRTSVFRIQGDQTGGFTIPDRNEGYGSYGSHSIVKVTGSSGDSGMLLWIGPGGVMAWDGSGPPVSLSSPPSDGDDVRGIEETVKRINPIAVDGIVSNYNPTYKIARWFVPVDGSLFNNFVINYHLQTRCFTFGACDGVTAVESVVGSDGSYVTIAGQMDGSLWQMDSGYSDGAYGFECRQLVATWTTGTRTATVSGTPLPTSSGGLTGVPVLLVSADGTVQRAIVASNTSSAVVFVEPPTAPAVGTQMIFGGIFWRMKSSKFNLGLPEIRKTLSSMLIQFTTSTAGQIWVAFSVNNSDPTCFVLMDGTTDYVDLTVAKGVKYCEANRGPGMVLQVDIFALAPGFDLDVAAIEATVKTRDEVKR